MKTNGLSSAISRNETPRHAAFQARVCQVPKLLWTFLSLTLTGTLSAETLLWYRFDEQAPGTTATYGAPVVNSAGSAFHGVIDCRQDANTFGENKNVLPVYREAFPDDVLIYDPVSKARFSNSRALQFKPWINQNLPCSAVRILNGNQITPENFTIEMFIKSFNTSKCMQWLIKSAAWDLWANGGEKGNGRFQYKGQSATVNGNALADKAWHHIAVVRNGGTVTFYQDYKQIHQLTGEGRVDYSTVQDLVIGSSLGRAYGGWEGLIDEVRISGTALTPSQFLRLVHAGEPFDPDVYFHFSGEPYNADAFGELAPLAANLYLGAAYDTLSSGGALQNDAIAYRPLNRLLWDGTYGAKPVMITEDLPGAIIRHGLVSATGRTDAYALKFAANRKKDDAYDALSAYLWVNDPAEATLAAGSFTSECFIKYLSAPEKQIQYIMWQYGGLNGARMNSWCLSQSGSRFCAMVWSLDETGAVQSHTIPEPAHCTSLADDAWHHIAFVYNREKRRVSVYLDHHLYGEKHNIELFSEPAPDVTHRQIEFGTGYNGFLHQMNGCFDEIRITRRALDPQEFLTTLPATSGDTLFLATFDHDLTVQPYPGVSPTGSVLRGSVSLTGRQRPFTYFDGQETVEKSDGAALVLNDAALDFGRNLMLESEQTVTVEFLADIHSVSADARIMTFADGTGTPVWSIAAGDVPNDRPHAVALTVDARLGMQTLFVDGTVVSRSPVTIPASFTGSSFTIGDAGLTGTLDEIRVSRGLLDEDAFFRLAKKETILLIR